MPHLVTYTTFCDTWTSHDVCHVPQRTKDVASRITVHLDAPAASRTAERGDVTRRALRHDVASRFAVQLDAPRDAMNVTLTS